MADDDEVIRLGADVSAAVANLEKLEQAAKGTGDALSASFVKADVSASQFLAQVETGGKGAERSMALLAVQINAVESEIAQLKAAGKPTAVMEAGLDSLRAKLALGTAQLGKFRAAQADAADATRKATQRAGEFSGSITDVTGTLKTFSPAIGDAIDKYSILAAKAFVAVKALQVATEGLKATAQATGNYNGQTKDAIDSASGFATSLASFDFAGAIANFGKLTFALANLSQNIDESTVKLGEMADAAAAKNFASLLKVQQDLVQGHEAEVEALNKKAEALSREITTQQAAGEVQKYIRDAVLETLNAYAKAGEEVPAKLAEQAAALGIVSTEQAKATESAAKLEEASVGGSERRAAAEESSSARIIAALDAQSKAADAKLAADQARLEAALGKGGKIDTSQATSEATQELDGLQQKISELENTPLISPEQLNSLNTMKDRAATLKREVGDLNKVFTQTANDFLTEAEAADAASAAWDVYRDRVDQAAIRQNRALAETDAANESLSDFSDTASDAAENLSDAADAAGDVGKKAKKGAEEGAEGLDKLKGGLEEAIPLANELKGILAEIVALGAQADI